MHTLSLKPNSSPQLEEEQEAAKQLKKENNQLLKVIASLQGKCDTLIDSQNKLDAALQAEVQRRRDLEEEVHELQNLLGEKKRADLSPSLHDEFLLFASTRSMSHASNTMDGVNLFSEITSSTAAPGRCETSPRQQRFLMSEDVQTTSSSTTAIKPVTSPLVERVSVRRLLSITSLLIAWYSFLPLKPFVYLRSLVYNKLKGLLASTSSSTME
jgi:hypothetical protein